MASDDPTRLAIDGGPATLPEGPPPWPRDNPQVRDALAQAARDGSWGRYHGPHLDQLIVSLRQQLAIESVYPCCSGTFAVELALATLGIGGGDEVLLGAYDFAGNFRAIEARGARPVLIDIRADDATLDLEQLDDACRPQTRALIVSHLHGGLVDMPRVVEWARARGIAVVEDACQALGATVAGRPAGTWGDAGVLSFGGSKLITAGRGGALISHRPELIQRAKIFCEQGNHAFPLSELQALVLLPQLEQLADDHARRRAGADRLRGSLATIPGLRAFAAPRAGDDPAYYKLGLWFEPAAWGSRSRSEFIAAAQREGVAIDAGFRGFAQRSPRRCRHHGPLDVARRAGEQMLVLHHPVLLTPAETLDRVAATLLKIAHAWGAI